MNEFGTEYKRRPKMYLSSFGSNVFFLKHPWVSAWWSAAFPGFGQLFLCQYFKGFVLFSWEVLINTQANLNLAIYYSLTGRFAEAKAVVDINWLLLYGGIYIYAIWDSYRSTVTINKLAMLADRQESPIPAATISLLESNYLEKHVPINSLLWSMLTPGAGQLYVHRFVVGLFILFWWVVLVYKSHLFLMIYLTLTGDMFSAIAAASPGSIEWLLFIPSIFCFAGYDAYMTAVEINRLFDTEQKRFLRDNYQQGGFLKLKLNSDQAQPVFVMATVDHSLFLEIAISDLVKHNIPKENIVVVPLDKKAKEIAVLDTIHRADGVSILDSAAILGTIFMLLGIIYGLIWEWGPIIWGLIGLVIGGATGLLADYLITKKGRQRSSLKARGEIIIIVECNENETEQIEKILWEHMALGVTSVRKIQEMNAAHRQPELHTTNAVLKE